MSNSDANLLPSLPRWAQHMLMRTLLPALALIMGAANAMANPTAPHQVTMTVNFVDKTDEQPSPRFKAFRRYGLGEVGLPNVMDLHCTRLPGGVSNMVFRIPANYTLRSFPRTSHDITFPVSIQTDNGRVFRFTGTYYRDGEIFIDRFPNLKDAFDEVLSATTITLVFGRQNDTIEYAVDSRVDSVLSGMIVHPNFRQALGAFRQLRPQTVVDRCAELSPIGERLSLSDRVAPVRCGAEPRGTVCRVANRHFLFCRRSDDLRGFESEVRSSRPEMHRDVIARYAGRCGATTAIIMNDVATPENVWEGGAEHPAVSREVFILPLPAVMPAQAAPAPQAQAPAAAQEDEPARMPSADLVPYGSRAGMYATIVERRGIGTANARVRIVHTEANAKAFCVEYSSDHSEACVRRTMRGVRLRPEMTANCRTGAFTGPFGNRFQFRGKRRDGSPKYSIVDVTRREELDGSGASGYSEILEQYAALCGRPQ